MHTVIVAFRVNTATPEQAEAVVEGRLTGAKLLWQNDSNDIINGTLDPIDTFCVVPLAELLEASL